MTKRNLQLVIITGMSGAGKTVAMQSLEDNGFYCVDNLPVDLLPKFSDLMKNSTKEIDRVAIAIDLRTHDFLEELPKTLKKIEENQEINYTLLFLEADNQTLISRYKHSRRRHPLSTNDSPLSGVRKERQLLTDIKNQANIVIDTSSLKAKELKEKIANYFSAKKSKMTLIIMSFGFKYGNPIDADLVFDVRFLPNPYYDEYLRPKTGKDPDVASYVLDSDKGQEYLEKLLYFLEFSIPQYVDEGKAQLVIGIGCTGGKHRSVAIVEKLGEMFQDEYDTFIMHRDLGRE